MKAPDIRVELYESFSELSTAGANITISKRARYILHKMNLEDACLKACRNAGDDKSKSPDLQETNKSTFRRLDALRISRGDFMKILFNSVPSKNLRLGKKLTKYTFIRENGPIGLQFSDGTRAICDVLVGSDGVRSTVRGQLMREKARLSDDDTFHKHVDPRWSGTIIYRSLIPRSRLAVQNPNHSLLSTGQIYLGNNQHITAHPFSNGMLDVAISITDLSKEGSPWPSNNWSSQLDKETSRRKLAKRFLDSNKEVQDLIKVFDMSIETAVMDVEPLPFYVRGHVALIGDAAHSALPYTGGNASMAIEDAYALGRILRISMTTKDTLPISLRAYQRIRKPHGNNNIHNARQVLREFQLNGNSGTDMESAIQRIRYHFHETFATTESTPDTDLRMALSWMNSEMSKSRHGRS
ncbi:hypothetical protein Clacol_008004 [Clathrus columnatus]|uniref:FAD-binding domain-containing protein n=1 Tax=Clathrus columnatus TaxID=1419009 RepID=A0AAV5AKY2_9AGAM|nr:hypothetical protein Clacol_008004 [Clathrus columnatus]